MKNQTTAKHDPHRGLFPAATTEHISKLIPFLRLPALILWAFIAIHILCGVVAVRIKYTEAVAGGACYSKCVSIFGIEQFSTRMPFVSFNDWKRYISRAVHE